jgi:UDP-N-acetylmuramoyl-tripeptide--D-alanyl-D-alanine ligase
MSAALPRGLPPETAFTGVSIDSRKVRPGDLFVAIRGERLDGHDFVVDALQAGAPAAVVAQSWLAGRRRRVLRASPLIPVADTVAALQGLARYHRRRLGIPVVGVTGSNGKTTTKEMIAAVLGAAYRVLRSEGSFNNHIGVPLTLLRLRRTHEVAVIELGMNHPGELARLCSVALPTGGVVTNVGPAHLEFLQSVDEVARAKAELVEAIGKDGFVVLNADDEHTPGIRALTEARVVTFGFGPEADIRGELVGLTEGACPLLRISGSEPVRIPLAGAHNAANALAAAAVGEVMGCTPDQVRSGLESFQPPHWRSETFETGGMTVINDAYNANPVSTARALEMLRDWAEGGERRKVAVLGDMLELGGISEQAHRELGERAAAAGVGLLVTVGRYAAVTAEGAARAGLASTLIVPTSSIEHAWEVLQGRLEPGDVILLKGSRRIGLERLAERVREAGVGPAEES